MSTFALMGKGIANENKRFPSVEIKTADKIIACFQPLPGFSSRRSRGRGACRVDGVNVATLHSGIPGVNLHCIAQGVQVAGSHYLWVPMYSRKYRMVQALQSEDE